MSGSENTSSTTMVGLIVAERLFAGLICDHKLSGELLSYPTGARPENDDEDQSLVELHTDALVSAICELVLEAAKGRESELAAVGIALPGLIRNGVVEEAPNLPQLKGVRVGELLTSSLRARDVEVPVLIVNDAE